MKIAFLLSWLQTLTVLIILFSSFNLIAQSNNKGSVTGKVIDSKLNRPLEQVTVSLSSLKDSVLVSRVVTKADGTFIIPDLALGNYSIKFSLLGFEPVSKDVPIVKSGTLVDMGVTAMEEGITLKDVLVQGEITAITVKKDTIRFNAGAYKTAPDAMVEDLLRKLPGIQIDANGTITANGQPIEKLTVDGKLFFGGDPTIASKNLPAEIIKSVEIINDKNDKAKDTGIDDGKREKVLNLVIKEDKKNGWFGNASVSAGTHNRYLGSASANRFSKSLQYNALFLGNNTNRTGFSSEDAGNFSGSENEASSSGISVDGTSMDGLINTVSGALNLSDTWGKKQQKTFSGSYILNSNTSNALSYSNIQNIQPDQVYYNTNTVDKRITVESHRSNLSFVDKPDSLTTLRIKPYFNISQTRSSNMSSVSLKSSSQQVLNDGSATNSSKMLSPQINSHMSLTRKLKQEKGSVSLDADFNYSRTNSDNRNETDNKYYNLQTSQIFNRFEKQEKKSNYIRIESTFNKNAGKAKNISLIYTPSYALYNDNANAAASEYNPASGRYELTIDSLTNIVDRKELYFMNVAAFNVRLEKWNFYGESNFRKTWLEGELFAANLPEHISRTFFNVVPSLSVSFDPKPGRSFNFNIWAEIRSPKLHELQRNQYNTDPLNIRIGNPGLKQQLNYNSDFSYSSSNPGKRTSFNLYSYFRIISRAVASNNALDPVAGVRTYYPVNVNGSYNFDVDLNGSFPTKIKGLTINPGLKFENSRNTGFIDSKPNNSDRYSQGATLTISYSFKDKVNITQTNASSYIQLFNSAQPLIKNTYFSTENYLFSTYEFIKKWRLNTESVYRSYAGQHYIIANATIQKYFMKSSQLNVELKSFDLFNQNKNIQRIVSGTQISDIRTNSLSRYFYVKLTYKMNKI